MRGDGGGRDEERKGGEVRERERVDWEGEEVGRERKRWRYIL